MSNLLYFSPDENSVFGWREIEVIKGNDGDIAVPTQIEVLQAGAWDTPGHGSFEINDTDLQEYVDNFNNGVRKGVPIDLEHKTDGGAVGWVKSLSKQGSSLFANVEWTKAGAQALADKAYRFFSPEFAPRGYKDPEGKQTADRNVLIGGALTNRPLFKNLQAIVANDTGNGDKSTSGLTGGSGVDNNNVKGADNMQLEDIRKLDPASLTGEQKTFLGEHKAELSLAEQTAFGLTDNNADADAKAKADAEAKATADAEAAKAEADKQPAGVAASEQTVTIKASDLEAMNSKIAALTQDAELGKQAHEELAYKKAHDHVHGLAFNDGKFKAAPTSVDAVTKFYQSLDATQREAFDKDVVANINTSAITAGEIGADNTGELTEAGTALDKRAEEIVKAGEKDGKQVPYSHALRMARDENPELSKQYERELQPTKAEV